MATLLQKNNAFEGVNADNPLQKSSRAMGETVSGLTNQLVNPFKTVTESVNSGVALVSEKQSAIASVISGYKSEVLTGIANSLKNITGGLLNIGDLGSIITYKDGFKVNTDELLRIGSKGLGFNINSMASLKQQIGDGFIDELNKMSGGLAGGLIFADGTKLSINPGWKMATGMSIVDFLGKDDPDGFGTVTNLAAVNSVLNVMLNQTVQNGIWQGYDNFQNMYVFESDYHDQLIDSANNSINFGDFQSIKTILDIIGTDGVNKVKFKYPELIETLLGNFAFSPDDSVPNYPQIKELLLKVITTVGGSNWYKYPTSVGMAINVGMVNNISTDAKLLLSDEDELAPLLCSAGIFIDQSANSVFIQDFPKAVVF